MVAHAEYLTTEYLHECFSIDSESGILTWRVRPREHFNTDRGHHTFNTRFSGKKAGGLTANGYARVVLNGNLLLAHRVIWTMETGNWPSAIDHISGDRSDNRISNLREATQSQNMRNVSISRRNTSGATGVSWDIRKHKWQAKIMADGKQIMLGRFKNKADAIAARKAAEVKHGYSANHGRPRASQ